MYRSLKIYHTKPLINDATIEKTSAHLSLFDFSRYWHDSSQIIISHKCFAFNLHFISGELRLLKGNRVTHLETVNIEERDTSWGLQLASTRGRKAMVELFHQQFKVLRVETLCYGVSVHSCLLLIHRTPYGFGSRLLQRKSRIVTQVKYSDIRVIPIHTLITVGMMF